MTRRHLATLGVFLTASSLAPVATHGEAQDPIARTGGIYDQLVITLPDGWSSFDQDAAISGKAGPHGVVFFSAQPVTKEPNGTADPLLLAKVDTGEIVSFFVDRSNAGKGATCDKISRSYANTIGSNISQDPAIVTVGRRMFQLAPSHTDIDVGKCHGVRFQLEAHKDDPAKHWKIDARAVSDGKVLYIFSVRHPGKAFDESLAVFEKVMSTVQLKQAN